MNWLHYIGEILYFINPCMMIGSCVIWIKLYNAVKGGQNNLTMRLWILEKSIDHLMGKNQSDGEYLYRLKKINEELKQ